MKILLVMIFAIALLGAPIGQAKAEKAGEAKGNLRYTIMVSKFENKSRWSGRWHLGNAFGTIMTDALMASGSFVVLGEADMRKTAMQEQDLATTGRMKKGKKTPKIGQITPAQLLVKGIITHVENDTSGQSGCCRAKHLYQLPVRN